MVWLALAGNDGCGIESVCGRESAEDKKPSKKDLKVPKSMEVKYDDITAITDRVCREHLSEDDAALSRNMAAEAVTRVEDRVAQTTLEELAAELLNDEQPHPHWLL